MCAKGGILDLVCGPGTDGGGKYCKEVPSMKCILVARDTNRLESFSKSCLIIRPQLPKLANVC